MDIKNIEHNHFILFRTMLPDFPKGEVWHEDNPDFLIHTSQGILGLELTRVHKPSSQNSTEQAFESQSDEIISLAQKHAELRGTPEVYATILFKQFTSLKKKQRLELARIISRIINDKISSEEDIKPLKKFEIRQPNLPEQLSSIHFMIAKEGWRHSWRCARAGWALEDCEELIQKTINEKSKKYQNYLKNCKECWLLLVAEMKPSGFIHPDKNSIDHIYFSPFERTYFLDCGERRLHILKTEKG